MKTGDEVLFKTVGSEVVLLDLRRGLYFGLDETGARIWTLIREGCDAPQIVAALMREYEAEEEEIAASVQRFVGDLKREGVVVE